MLKYLGYMKPVRITLSYKISAAFKLYIDVGDVVNIFRTKNNNVNYDKPKSIVVSFQSKLKRDKFMAAKIGVKLTTTFLNDAQNNPTNIFINEQ